jgi:hypothetical protein
MRFADLQWEEVYFNGVLRLQSTDCRWRIYPNTDGSVCLTDGYEELPSLHVHPSVASAKEYIKTILIEESYD